MCPKCWCICCVIFLIFGLAVRMSYLTTAMCPKCWCICCVIIFKFWPCCTDVPSDDSNVPKVLVYLLCYLLLFLIFGLTVRMSHLTTACVQSVGVFVVLFVVIFNFWPCCTDVPSDDSNVSKVLVYLLCYLLLFLIFGIAVRMSHLTTAMCPKCWCICCVICYYF